MSKSHLVLGIGELLWDIIPVSASAGESETVAHLGGAPSNFAVMIGRLGDRAVILSRVGQDALGKRALEQLTHYPVDPSLIQIDPKHETSRATVVFKGTQAISTIHQPVAWDFLELTAAWERAAERADALCFGSLAQRSPETRATIQKLVSLSSNACVRVFDVNLRPPFVNCEILRESMELATVVKLNDDELPRVLELLHLPAGAGRAEEQNLAGAQRLLEKFPTLKMVALTRGAHGSLLVTNDEWHAHPGLPVKVADTIGAGDAFTAAMTHYLLRGADLLTLNEAGNRWGAWVASQNGAMPPLSPEIRASIEAEISSIQS